MVNSSTNNNKMNNHLLTEVIEHTKDYHIGKEDNHFPLF